MKKNKTNNKGITMVTLVVAVSILIILSSMLIYNAKNGIKIRNLKMMQNDIELLDNKINSYYLKYGKLPAEIKYKGILPETLVKQPNDNDEYLVIDLVALDGMNLNYGSDYNNIKTEADSSNYDDIYIVNSQSHRVYYVRGVEMDGVRYHTNGTDDEIILQKITINGKRYNKETNITINDVPITIPGGATVSGLEDETTPDDGFVIYMIPEGTTVDWNDETAVENAQKTYDQFVWVPVPNAIAKDMNNDNTIDETDIDLMIAEGKYPMAIKVTGTDDYRGVLYDFTLTDGEVVISDKEWSEDSTGYREPDIVSLYDNNIENLNQVNGILNTNYTNSSEFKNALQTEYNEMVKKVARNKGFWVGRYETSGMSNETITSYDSSNEIKINVVKGTTEGINNTTWYKMYAQQQIYAKKANTTGTSSMIAGSQWDQIMIWMKDIDNTSQNSKYIVNSIGMGNFGNIAEVDDGYSETSNPAPTGCFAIKNVYDLAGNVNDWTLEANDANYRVIRGGHYFGVTYTTAEIRYGNDSSTYSGASVGSRIILY